MSLQRRDIGAGCGFPLRDAPELARSGAAYLRKGLDAGSIGTESDRIRWADKNEPKSRIPHKDRLTGSVFRPRARRVTLEMDDSFEPHAKLPRGIRFFEARDERELLVGRAQEPRCVPKEHLTERPRGSTLLLAHNAQEIHLDRGRPVGDPNEVAPLLDKASSHRRKLECKIHAGSMLGGQE
jgi:hypothetical protein